MPAAENNENLTCRLMCTWQIKQQQIRRCICRQQQIPWIMFIRCKVKIACRARLWALLFMQKSNHKQKKYHAGNLAFSGGHGRLMGGHGAPFHSQIHLTLASLNCNSLLFIVRCTRPHQCSCNANSLWYDNALWCSKSTRFLKTQWRHCFLGPFAYLWLETFTRCIISWQFDYCNCWILGRVLQRLKIYFWCCWVLLTST